MIPKVIHYCWFGENPLPDDVKGYIESWKKHCPDYEIREWNESNFDINRNTYVKEAYQAKKWAFVTDYVRLYALYHEGGFYMDTDVELLKSLDPYTHCHAFSGFEDDTHIPTALMGSEKHGEWVEYLLSYYDSRHFIKPDGSPDVTTNVTTITNMTKEKYKIRLDNTYQDIKGALTIYPKDYFCPKSYATNEISLTENTVCIHHFKASWHSKYENLCHEKRQKYIKKYGREKGTEKYARWAKRNYLRLAFMHLGVKGFVRKVLKHIFCMTGRVIYGNNIILMESLNGFDGNSGALYNYLRSESKYDKYKFVWFIRENIPFKKIDSRAWERSFRDNSLRANLLHSAGRYIFFDNVPIRPFNKRQICVYLTHGCPPLKNVKGLINVPSYVNHSLCTSEETAELLSYQFSVSESKLFICGLPRNDALFETHNEVKHILDIDGYEKIILWLPTFRKSAYEERSDSGKIMELGIPLINNNSELTELNEFLYKRNVKLIIKIHPGQDMSVIKIKPQSNIMLLSDAEMKANGVSLYELMPVTDALLTDYSSVAFDYMLLDKPIGYIVDDIKEYKLGFAVENPFTLMPGHKIEVLEQLYGFVEDIIIGKDIYSAERNKVSRYANTYQDNNNCKRIAEYLGL